MGVEQSAVPAVPQAWRASQPHLTLLTPLLRLSSTPLLRLEFLSIPILAIEICDSQTVKLISPHPQASLQTCLETAVQLVVFPDSSNFTAASRCRNSRFDLQHIPAAVARVRSTDEAAAAVRCAVDSSIKVGALPRAPLHSLMIVRLLGLVRLGCGFTFSARNVQRDVSFRANPRSGCEHSHVCSMWMLCGPRGAN